MIRLGPYRFTNWQAVKINWKRGVRGPVSGHAVKGGIKTYEKQGTLTIPTAGMAISAPLSQPPKTSKIRADHTAPITLF